MDLDTVKIGDKDSLGRAIQKIFIRSTRNAIIENDKEKKEEVKYLIYETDDGILRYDALNEFAKKLVVYSELLQTISVLLDIDKSLRGKYNQIVANALRKIFETNQTINLKEFLTKIKSKIESNIFSIARLRYLKKCLNHILKIIIIVLLFWGYQSSIAGNYFFRDFNDIFSSIIYLAVAGAIGGFISISLKINVLPIDPYIPFKRTELDANVRIVLAMISGVLIYWFLQSGFVTFIATEKLNYNSLNGKYLSLSIAVLAGFSERLIPNILSKKENDFLSTKENEEKKIVPKKE